ncbi:hypothetical protein ACEPAF_4120 [Sanghuangporus sanghuang]
MSTQTLRMSASHGSMRPSSSSAAVGGPNPPRDHRRERRKPAIATSTSPSSFGGIVNSASASTFQRARSPSPTSSTRLEENYLAIKRRTHRRSYFDHYPERSARRREKAREEVEDRRSEGMELQPPLLMGSVGVATADRDEEEDEGDTFETFGRTTMRKSLSVGGGEASSSSLARLSRKGKEQNELFSSEVFDRDQIREGGGVAFPTIGDAQRQPYAREDASSSLHPQPKSSTSTTTQSRNFITPKAAVVPYGAYRDDVPTLRYSYSTYSSSQTQGETLTPPQTPVEPSARGLIHVVVAPVPGVEAMDALVDGMDGSDEDELFKRLQSSTSKRSVPSHHPLYAPPLPQPPPGIVLGRGYPARKVSLSSESDDDEELQVRSTTFGGKERSSAKRRHEGGRTASSSTILADMSDRGHQRPSTASTYTQEEHERVPPPSIDEIIRKHTAVPPHLPSYIAKKQPNGQSQSRPTTGTKSLIPSNVRHDRRQEPSLSDSEPEPLTPSEEAALVARSSIDSVTAEVQQSLRLHKTQEQSAASSAATSNASMSQEDTPSNTKRLSHYSSKTSRSAGGCDQSIRSGSASASTSNGVGANSGSPALMSDPELPLDLLALQHSNGKRAKQDSQKEAIATYLRSARMTTLLKLTRRPHASTNRPLTVSLSDLGSATGFPLVVFLGLGCVRYVMGLYDEMAECLGLRLITIDRWGLGRTDVPPTSASRGVPEWTTVVEEVLDRLNIDKCAVMAHSAGAPYALSFASRNPQRIVGDICLLAPWVGGGAGGGYRWLRYIPNGLLKTAQAAEWKIQAWMIGKPPKITYEGIGYNINTPVSSAAYNIDSSGHFVRARDQNPSFDEEEEYDETPDFSSRASIKRGKSSASVKSSPYTVGVAASAKSRPSISSGNTFSDYDDLADFNGRFDSQSTFERRRTRAASTDGHTSCNEQGSASVTRKRPSKGFLRIWKGLPHNNPGPVPPLPNIDTTLNEQQSPQTPQPKRKLKSLKSISSIKSRSSTTTNVPARPRTAEKSPVLPEQDFETSLQFAVDEFGLKDASNTDLTSEPPNRPRLDLDTKVALPHVSAYSAGSVDTKNGLASASSVINRPPYGPRASGRRSISFTSTTSASQSLFGRPPLPQIPRTLGRSSTASSPRKENGESFQVAMGNALIAASHAESARGTHPDLLQILNHEQRPWGFSYARYPHRVRVWYGDKDERIAADAVKWMEGAMGQDRCRVTVVKGADHGLMYRTNVVVDVLEEVCEAWAASVHGSSRKREYSSRSEPITPSGLELGSDPFKFF